MSLGPSSRPHICFALPGIHYSHNNAYSLCTLPIIPFLERDFEVTLVYRKLLESPNSVNHRYLTVLGDMADSPQERQNRQRYFNGDSRSSFYNYQWAIQQFAQQHAKTFDLVIEKQWPWIGATVNAFAQVGIPASLVLEAWWHPKYSNRSDAAKSWLRGLLSPGLQAQRRLSCRHWSQQAASIVTETQEMGDILREQRYIPESMTLHTIPNGMDAQVFYPRDRQHCRQTLKIAPDATVLTYVGSLSRGIQEPGHLIEALGREQCQGHQANTWLYIVGDGWKRQELEAIAHQYRARVVFTGRVPQTQAAQYIGAANLCVAPYDLSMFFQHRFTSGSLKVPEYLACGRLILTSPCNHMRHLTADEAYGFLVENHVEGYRRFFQQFPSKQQLIDQEAQLQQDLATGSLRRNKILVPWSDIAEAYKIVIEEALARQTPRRTFSLAV